MTTYLSTQTIVNKSANFTAAEDTYYIVDTASAGVTVTLPTGILEGHWITIQNAPTNGKQVGGAAAGHDITINAGSGETITGNSSETLGAPTSTVTASCRRYFPTGANSGTGTGEAGITGWDTN